MTKNNNWKELNSMYIQRWERRFKPETFHDKDTVNKWIHQQDKFCYFGRQLICPNL